MIGVIGYRFSLGCRLEKRSHTTHKLCSISLAHTTYLPKERQGSLLCFFEHAHIPRRDMTARNVSAKMERLLLPRLASRFVFLGASLSCSGLNGHSIPSICSH